jgi:CrcB protein
VSVIAGVAALGAVGATARYLVDRLVTVRTGGRRPWGTFVINATGAFLLGLITGLALHHHIGDTTKAVLGTGFCGAFTTFSTFAYETPRRPPPARPPPAAANLVVGLVLGLALAAAGLGLASAI